jgi:drug/metabolite transporter (DMT)-like permease
VAVAFALASALCYGLSDYLAGVTSRTWDSRVVTAAAQLIGVITAVVAVLLFPGNGPAAAPILWGAVSGIGSAIGVLALYRGLAVGSMNVVAPVCGVLTCVIPAVVGILLGDHLTAVELAGIALAVPAVALVSRQQPQAAGSQHTGGAPLGLLAGAGFGLLFVALDQAGTQHGAWPLLPGQVVSLLLVLPFAFRGWRATAIPDARTLVTTAAAGILSGGANLLYLAATRYGQLAIVGVLSSLYPAGTVLIARLRLSEHWSRTQLGGMISAVLAVIFVVTG